MTTLRGLMLSAIRYVNRMTDRPADCSADHDGVEQAVAFRVLYLFRRWAGAGWVCPCFRAQGVAEASGGPGRAAGPSRAQRDAQHPSGVEGAAR